MKKLEIVEMQNVEGGDLICVAALTASAVLFPYFPKLAIYNAVLGCA